MAEQVLNEQRILSLSKMSSQYSNIAAITINRALGEPSTIHSFPHTLKFVEYIYTSNTGSILNSSPLLFLIRFSIELYFTMPDFYLLAVLLLAYVLSQYICNGHISGFIPSLILASFLYLVTFGTSFSTVILFALYYSLTLYIIAIWIRSYERLVEGPSLRTTIAVSIFIFIDATGRLRDYLVSTSEGVLPYLFRPTGLLWFTARLVLLAICRIVMAIALRILARYFLGALRAIVGLSRTILRKTPMALWTFGFCTTVLFVESNLFVWTVCFAIALVALQASKL